MANGVRQTSVGVVTTSGGVAVTTAQAAEMLDSFEDQDMTEYTQNDGDSGDYGFVTGDGASDGTYALSNDGDSNHVEFIGDGSFPVAFEQGDTLRYTVHPATTSDTTRMVIYFACQSANLAPECYKIRTDFNEPDFSLRYWDGSSATGIATSVPTFNAGNTYWIQTDWNTDGSMEGRLYNGDPENTSPATTINGSDTTLSSGYHGMDWDHSLGNKSIVDNLAVYKGGA